jgi:hypothetical protein
VRITYHFRVDSIKWNFAFKIISVLQSDRIFAPKCCTSFLRKSINNFIIEFIMMSYNFKGNGIHYTTSTYNSFILVQLYIYLSLFIMSMLITFVLLFSKITFIVLKKRICAYPFVSITFTYVYILF